MDLIYIDKTKIDKFLKQTFLLILFFRRDHCLNIQTECPANTRQQLIRGGFENAPFNSGNHVFVGNARRHGKLSLGHSLPDAVLLNGRSDIIHADKYK